MRNIRSWLPPSWARSRHPLLQYQLSQFRAGGRRRFFLQLALLAVLLGGGSALYAATLLQPESGANLSRIAWQCLYFPTLVLQLLTAIMALALGAATVGGERSRKTWDKLRVTELGAGLALRTRWVGILHRLRAPICLILLVRFLLVAALFYDLTAFGHLYPQILGAAARPPLPEWRLDLLLIALAVTVAILLPGLQIAAGAAFGILLSVALRTRIYTTVVLMLAIAAQLAAAGAGALLLAELIRGGLIMPSGWLYALAVFGSAFGDWGLHLAQLSRLGEIWQRVSYGSTISLALMILLAALGLAADGMLALAARLAERRE